MVIFADRSNVGDFGWAILGKRLYVMKLHIFITLNWMVIDKAIKHPVPALLFKNLLLLGIGNLSLNGSHQ
jgi:hypothetical protein